MDKRRDLPKKVKVMVYTKDREVYIRANRAPKSLETVILSLIDEYYNVKDLGE